MGWYTLHAHMVAHKDGHSISYCYIYPPKNAHVCMSNQLGCNIINLLICIDMATFNNHYTLRLAEYLGV